MLEPPVGLRTLAPTVLPSASGLAGRWAFSVGGPPSPIFLPLLTAWPVVVRFAPCPASAEPADGPELCANTVPDSTSAAISIAALDVMERPFSARDARQRTNADRVPAPTCCRPAELMPHFVFRMLVMV